MARQPIGRHIGTAFFRVPLLMLAALAGLFAPGAAWAQGVGCMVQPAGTPARQVLHCRDGLRLETESGAAYTLVDRNRDGRPEAVNLQSRAILLDVGARSRGVGFQVLTPQAVAAVRGTRWAVDAGEGKTAVFVLSGRVAVRRPNARTGVELGPGEGVDVSPGAVPLVVRRWPVARANALLARFGLQIR